MKLRRPTTALPQSLVEELFLGNGKSLNHPPCDHRATDFGHLINTDTSVHPSPTKLNKPFLSRKDARKHDRTQRRSRKAHFFSASLSNHNNQVPSPPLSRLSSHEDKPTRRTIHTPPSMQSFPDKTSTGLLPKRVTFDVSVQSREMTSHSVGNHKKRLIRHPTASRSRGPALPPLLSESQQSQAELDELAEIEWLETKLGIRNNKTGLKRSYNAAFAEDGLDELIMDLDRIAAPPLGKNRLSDESICKGDAGELKKAINIPLEPDHASSDEQSHTSSALDSQEWNGIEGIEELPSEIPSSHESGRYLPPHLRTSTDSTAEAPRSEQLQKLFRRLNSLINKLSEQNISSILTELEAAYRDNPRNDVTTTLTTIITDTVASPSILLDSFLILHAGLVGSLHKIIGLDFSAHFVEALVSKYDGCHKQAPIATQSDSEAANESAPEQGKEAINVLVLLSELYVLQVISYTLIYDIVRSLLDGNLNELDVELLLKVLKTCGQQLHQDDTSALKDIIGIVQTKMAQKNPITQSSRVRFMIETLTNLKGGKSAVRKNAPGQQGLNIAAESVDKMKKFLRGLGAKYSLRANEPLNVSLHDLRSVEKKGKWWLVGSAWAGDPLVDHQTEKGEKPSTLTQGENMSRSSTVVSDSLEELARKQGMNTEVRRSIFVVLMSSEDYMDACEKLGQLNLTEIQQREIIRVILHCCGNEAAYNPYYTLVVQHLCQLSHSHKITLKYCFWDFLRDLGESSVGGEELMKGRKDAFLARFNDDQQVPASKSRNVARAYAWWIAKASVPLTILKTLDFVTLQPQTSHFLSILICQMIISSQTVSPALDFCTRLEAAAGLVSKNREALELVAIKATRHPNIIQGLLHFFDAQKLQLSARTEPMRTTIEWGVEVLRDTLRTAPEIALGVE